MVASFEILIWIKRKTLHSERISVGLLTETRSKFSDLIRFGLEQRVRQRMCIVAKLPDLSVSGTCVCRYRTCMAQKSKCIYHVVFILHHSSTSSTNSKQQQNNAKKKIFYYNNSNNNNNNNTTTQTQKSTGINQHSIINYQRSTMRR